MRCKAIRHGRVTAFVLALTAMGNAFAQPAAPPPAPPPPPPAAPPAKPPPPPAAAETGAPPVPDESKKGEAKAHFDKGLALLNEEAYAAALAEFLVSRELYPTRAGTKNTAVCLRKLQRFDESLDMFETLLREFPNLPPETRKEAQQNIAELRELTGTIDIKGAEPGAAIVVSGQSRGEYPPISPLRVAAGAHLVRLVKEGFEPFEARVDVAGGQTATVTAKLRPLTASGRLKVIERAGRALEVYVDNTMVGMTPWEGTVPVGSHAVWLRRGRAGTAPAAVNVKTQQTSALTLVAEDLDSNLRVTPTPEGATVAIDGVHVGNGIWFGPLKSGVHKIEVATEGFLAVSREVKLERGGRENLTIKLERDPNSAMWRKPSRWTFDFDAGFSILPSLGGKPAEDCTGSCSRSLGVGALGFFHAGYQLGAGFGFGLSTGYLFATQSITGRSSTFQPISDTHPIAAQKGTADDALRLHAFLGGANMFYHLGDTVPVLFRVGVGAMVGQLRDERGGRYKTTLYGNSYSIDKSVTLTSATYIYVDPSVRVGYRIGDHMELAAGAQVLVLVGLSQPTWDKSIQLNAGPRSSTKTDGTGNYAADSLMGQVVIGVVPAASFRYDF
jgi:hypothetical protein